MPPKRKTQSVKDKNKKTIVSNKGGHEKKTAKSPLDSKQVSKKRKTDISEAPKAKKTKLEVEEKVKKVSNVKASSSSGSVELFSLLKDVGWRKALKDEFNKDYFSGITKQLETDRNSEVFPPEDLIFNAFNVTPIDKIKVVILGQDPYHDNGQAMGMSFSVPDGVKIPPSLKNIYKELEADKAILNFKTPDHGNLEAWAKEGVFLLNATLTVRAHQPNSHSKCGWQMFTDRVIEVISEECNGVVFILWGGFAHKKEKLINSTKHVVIKTAHPSPLSFNKFMNCKCFSDADKALKKLGKTPVDWSL